MKESLTPREFVFLERVYRMGDYKSSIWISDASNAALNVMAYPEAMTHLNQLLHDQVLQKSPDGQYFKITDFGVDLLQAKQHENEQWHKPGIIRVATFKEDETRIAAGNVFAAQRSIKEIFSNAAKSIDIADTYIGTELFDRLNDAGVTVDIRVLTQRCGSSPSYYKAFQQNYPGKIELKNAKAGVLHSRYVIIDKVSGYIIDHSIKDLGKKDAHVTKMLDVAGELALFEQRWADATRLASGPRRP